MSDTTPTTRTVTYWHSEAVEAIREACYAVERIGASREQTDASIACSHALRVAEDEITALNLSRTDAGMELQRATAELARLRERMAAYDRLAREAREMCEPVGGFPGLCEMETGDIHRFVERVAALAPTTPTTEAPHDDA